MAAMAPVMTTRNKLDQSSPWNWATNGSDAYYGLGDAQVAMIGQQEARNDDSGARLVINTGDGKDHILFKSGENVQGRIKFENSGLLLGSLASGNLGSNATAIGVNTTSSNSNTTAIGTNASATGSSATAIGYQSNAAGTQSTAIGLSAESSDYYAVAIGGSSKASRESISVGFQSEASGTQSTAIGLRSLASEKFSSAIGYSSSAKGPYSIASGFSSVASGDTSIAIGHSSKATELYSTSIGANSESTGQYNNAIGYTSKAMSSYTNALGYNAVASGTDAVAIGTNSSSFGIQSIAIGRESEASSNYATALGYNSSATDTQSTALGYGAIASAPHSTALGAESLASTTNSVALGYNAAASGNYAIAVGYNANAKGNNNIAIGVDACSNVLTNGANKICIGANSGPSESSSWNSDTVERIFIGSKSKFDGGAAVLEVHNDATLDTSFGSDYGSINKTAVVIHGGLVVTGPIYNLAKDKGAGNTWKKWGVLEYDHGGVGIQQGDQRGLGSPSRYPDYVNVAVKNKYPAFMGKSNNNSDRRLKYVGKESTSGLDKIRQLKIFNYTFKKDEKKTPHVGVIAQDLQKVFPDAVKKGVDGFLTIRFEDMFFAMINAIKELDSRITVLEKENQQIKAQNSELQEILKQVQNDSKKQNERLKLLESKIK